jgi:homospermidine synthase
MLSYLKLTFFSGVAPAELGWGTHEKKLPPNALEHLEGPQNQILLKSKGMNTTVRSWVPLSGSSVDSGDIIGYVIRHGEAYTISDHLTVRDNNGKALYRPTVHYAYRPSDSTIASLEELRMRHYRMQPKMRVLSDEIVSGQDILGCLLMGHDYKAWWIGSLLDIEEARELVPHQNATTMQVAISLASAVQWMIKNPQQGVCVPDDLPHEEILEQCWPWLGPCLSKPVNWSPLSGIEAESHWDYERKRTPDPDDEWQFSSFLVNSF